MRGKPHRRRARRAGRANSDAERRALAKANAPPPRWAVTRARPGFATLIVDGGARDWPPAAAIGYVLAAEDGAVLASRGEAIPPVSATVAEYRALLTALRHVLELGLDRVDARTDCRLLVAHVTGERRPNNRTLVGLGNEITDVTHRIGSVTIAWSPNEATAAAHALVFAALNAVAPDGSTR